MDKTQTAAQFLVLVAKIMLTETQLYQYTLQNACEESYGTVVATWHTRSIVDCGWQCGRAFVCSSFIYNSTSLTCTLNSDDPGQLSTGCSETMVYGTEIQFFPAPTSTSPTSTSPTSTSPTSTSPTSTSPISTSPTSTSPTSTSPTSTSPTSTSPTSTSPTSTSPTSTSPTSTSPTLTSPTSTSPTSTSPTSISPTSISPTSTSPTSTTTMASMPVVPCDTNVDCTAARTECRNSSCQCERAYVFHDGHANCTFIQDCVYFESTFQSAFIDEEYRDTPHTIIDTTEPQCMTECIALSNCKLIQYDLKKDQCLIFTLNTDNEAVIFGNFDHAAQSNVYQRDCLA